METITFKTFLMHKNEDKWEKLIDVKETPDMGGAPEMIDVTTLSDRMKRYIPGIQENEAKSFTANYDHTSFLALKALRNKEEDYAVWYGGTENEDGTITPTGSEGKFTFKGYLDVYANGGGVNEARNMTITLAASSVITEE